MFSIFSGKKVLVTGNTGFKGSWLSLWLLKCGAKVYGISLAEKNTTKTTAWASPIQANITQYLGEIADKKFVEQTIASIQPDFVFHLAAQPLVPYGVENPYETFNANVTGTLNVLEALRLYNQPCVAVFVTSDKCYAPQPSATEHRETDSLGGNDPYSASKAACEILIHSYAQTYFQNNPVKVASARAGNVIGGGDFAASRLIPDCIFSWNKGQTVKLRNAGAVRPWQHVMESVNGYLTLAEFIYSNPQNSGQSFNFGPYPQFNFKVVEVIEMLHRHYTGTASSDFIEAKESFTETHILKLNIDKALELLPWKPILNIEETIALTADWYKQYFLNPDKAADTTAQQLDFFITRKAAQK
jgi:CDP-glucose 4,6-dehydratase